MLSAIPFSGSKVSRPGADETGEGSSEIANFAERAKWRPMADLLAINCRVTANSQSIFIQPNPSPKFGRQLLRY